MTKDNEVLPDTNDRQARLDALLGHGEPAKTAEQVASELGFTAIDRSKLGFAPRFERPGTSFTATKHPSRVPEKPKR